VSGALTLSFFDGAARSADVKAVTASEVAEITAGDSAELAVRHPEPAWSALIDLGRILAQRLRATEENV
jgi:CRP-like cAMP-binding protein